MVLKVVEIKCTIFRQVVYIINTYTNERLLVLSLLILLYTESTQRPASREHSLTHPTGGCWQQKPPPSGLAVPGSYPGACADKMVGGKAEPPNP